MGDDLIPILTRFHREVVLPDIRRIVGEVVGDLEGRMSAHFDAPGTRASLFDLDREKNRWTACGGASRRTRGTAAALGRE